MVKYIEELREVRRGLSRAITEAPTNEALKVLGSLRSVVDDLLRDAGVSP